MRTFTKDDVREARSAMRFDGYNPYDTADRFARNVEGFAYVREWIEREGPDGFDVCTVANGVRS